MENRESVDQQPLQQFLLKYRRQLERQGRIVATWRRRNGSKLGPYFLLTCRDEDGRQRSVYLGIDSKVIEEARTALAAIQALRVETRQHARTRESLRYELAKARQQLDLELAVIGLRRQGSEIRGWSQVDKQQITRI